MKCIKIINFLSCKHKFRHVALTTNKCWSCGSHAKLSTSAPTDHLNPECEGTLPSLCNVTIRLSSKKSHEKIILKTLSLYKIWQDNHHDDSMIKGSTKKNFMLIMIPCNCLNLKKFKRPKTEMSKPQKGIQIATKSTYNWSLWFLKENHMSMYFSAQVFLY